jgi:small ligand-binding sensory domain FIST
MSARPQADAPPAPPFTVAHGEAEHWGLAAKACLKGIAAAAPAANIGILYATEAFAGDLSSILTFLRETTRIDRWVGAVAPGIIADHSEIHAGGGLAVMVGALPEGDFRTFAGLTNLTGAWEKAHGPVCGLVHGDPRNPALPALVKGMAADIGFLAGGLVSAGAPAAQLADSVVSGGLSGLMLGADIPVVAGLTQGCTPLGPQHMVTQAWDGVVVSLDGRPALEVFKHDVGELMARDISRAAGYVHVGLPVENSDTGDYLVRTLLGVDPRKGWLAVGDHIDVGQRLMFVRRDPNAARADMTRMLADVRRRMAGRRPRAAFYATCIGRGRHMFGSDGAETAMVQEALGPLPLIGFFANGEICGDRLYGYTGVLTVLVGEPP